MARQCPFCKEEIKDDAIKCKHCHSLLYKIEPDNEVKQEKDEKPSKYVTYILDKDLVRFGKFALSLLAIFITVGIILYGVDLKQTVKELNEANANLLEGNKKITTTLSKVDSLELQINNVQSEVDKALLRANEALAEINKKKDSAFILVGYIKNLDPAQLARLEEIQNVNPDKFSSKLDFKKLWKPGQTIKIFFLNGTQVQQEKVRNIAAEWTQYANLTFEYVNDKKAAQVRISFNEQGTWSFVGTDCLAIPQDQNTMALIVSVNKTPTFEDRQSILREFGHAIGLLNEILNPNATIKWNKKKVYEYYLKQFAWTKEQVDFNLFSMWPSKSKPFDSRSIMMNDIPGELTLDGVHTESTDKLSSMDKGFIAHLYPK